MVEKAQRGVLSARACFASLLEGIRLSRGGISAAGAAFGALMLGARFPRGKWLLCGILARLLRSRICGVGRLNWGFTGFQEIVL